MSLAKELLERYQAANEMRLNTLASACAKIDAIKDQDVPTNIAWVHSGLENQRCKYPDTVTTKNPGNGTNLDKALNSSRTQIMRKKLQKFLNDRRKGTTQNDNGSTEGDDYEEWNKRSMRTNALKYDGYKKIKKGSSGILDGDEDAIKKTSSGYVNGSKKYWKFRKDHGGMGHDMISTAKQ